MSLVQFRPEAPYADLAHLVERNLAKVEVAGSIPVIRSKNTGTQNVPVIIRRHGQAVRQRSATPLSPVRFRVAPPKNSESECFRNFFIQAAGLAYHRRTKCGAYHQPFGLYLITRQRVFSCGLMIYKAYRFDDIQFLAELMIYTPSA